MDESIHRLSILRITEGGAFQNEDVVTRETPLTIVFNNQELLTLLCSPIDLDYLAAGFLYSEGLIGKREDILKLLVDEQRGIARVEAPQAEGSDRELIFRRFITSGCGRGASFYSAADFRDQAKAESQVKFSALAIFALVKEFQHHSLLYRETGGVHSAALCDGHSFLSFHEDIGRHNAVDKIFGECLLRDIGTEDKVLITSGRISSEILLKVAKRKVPVIASISAPTDLAVRLADDLGITLIGFVRGKKMNVYTHPWRIITEEHGQN